MCRTKSERRSGGAGAHVHVLPARLTAVAGPQGGHPQGALPEDRRHQARHAHRGPVRGPSRLVHLNVILFT